MKDEGRSREVRYTPDGSSGLCADLARGTVPLQKSPLGFADHHPNHLYPVRSPRANLSH